MISSGELVRTNGCGPQATAVVHHLYRYRYRSAGKCVWRFRYDSLLVKSDLVRYICSHFLLLRLIPIQPFGPQTDMEEQPALDASKHQGVLEDREIGQEATDLARIERVYK